MKKPPMLEVLEQFRIVFKSIRRHYQSVERRAGISGAQLWALSEVAGKPGLKVGELARGLAIHQSTASNLLRRLVGLGLVRRRRAGRDQRTVALYVTLQGLKVLRRAPQPRIGVLQQALSDLPPARLSVMHRELAKLVAVMQTKDIEAARHVPLSEM
ncbi:MAG TPA: MarR family transcriptional regulator [Burkholderiales bacterium]